MRQLGLAHDAARFCFKLVRGPGPTFISFVNYLVPGWAAVAGALFLDESLSYWAYLGLALILLGIACSEFAPRMMDAIRAGLRRRRIAARLARQDAEAREHFLRGHGPVWQGRFRYKGSRISERF